MGKPVFILDRPDFIAMRKVLEDTANIDEICIAEDRLREARASFQAQNAKVTGDSKSAMQAWSMRIFDRPQLEAPAREYHRALVAWCKLTAQAFADVNNREVDAIDQNFPPDQFRKLSHLRDNHPEETGRRDAEREIRSLQEENTPHVHKRNTAVRGRNAVLAAFHLSTGDPIELANEDRFVKRNDPLKEIA